jgi:acetyltransferase-like isoleucine patch superfamily enzyme
MNINKLYFKIKELLFGMIFQKIRVTRYSCLSTINIGGGKLQPVLVNGYGRVKIGKNVVFGVKSSPYFYSGYSFINARRMDSYIEIGDNCIINNNATIISDGKRIIFGSKCLIGYNFQVMDSDFHDLNPSNRFSPKNIIKKEVIIGNNVFIGNNVTILKGVNVGENSILGSNSVIVKNVPPNVVVGGNPAKLIRSL